MCCVCSGIEMMVLACWVMISCSLNDKLRIVFFTLSPSSLALWHENSTDNRKLKFLFDACSV